MHIWGHFKTITKHKILVGKLCFKVHLYKQGLLHDLSKYTPTEFITGIKYYKGTYSPNSAERQVPAKMPYNYVLEMFCDRVAASKIYEGKNYTDAFPLQYYESGQYSYILHPETRALLRFMLVYLKDHGLDDTIKMINRHHDYDEYFVEFKDDFM